jgi:NAD(P)-dependent dehydrogenase (short-subunit alcohol dehydrogenase family)
VELARAAAEAVGEPAGLALRQVRWLRPVVVDTDRSLLVRLARTGAGLAVELVTGADGAPVVHAQGQLTRPPAPPVDGPPVDEPPVDEPPVDERIAIEEVRGRCVGRHDGAGLYAALAAAGLEYGPSLRALEWIGYRDGEALGRIRVPAEADRALDACVLHPALLEGALHTFAALRDPDGGPVMMPYAVESVDLLRVPDRSGYAHAVAAGPDRYHVTITDDGGRVCLRLRDFTLRPAPALGSAVPAPSSAAPAPDASLADLLYVPCWEPVALPATGADPGDGAWVVRHPARQVLADTLVEAHATAAVVGGGEEAELRGRPLPDTVYFLSGPAEPGAGHDDVDELDASQHRGVLSLFRLVTMLLAAGAAARELRLVVVTEDACDVAGEPVRNPYAASLHGLARSIAAEYPTWRVAVLDVDSRDVPAQPGPARATTRLIRRAAAAGDLIALRERAAYHRILRPLEPAPVPSPAIRDGGVYLILGGAGGIGLELTERLVGRHGARVVLVGRGELDQVRRDRLAGIDPDGRQVAYRRADAGDPESMRRLVTGILAEHGALHGVVHSTIVLRDRSLANMDEAAFRAALEAKSRVSVALRAALRGLPRSPDFVLFFSSAVSLSGSAGQSNYAAGCTFEDAYASYLRAELPGTVSVINWGYWGTVGIVAQDRYRERLARTGIFSISPAEGMAAVDHVLAHADPQVVVTKARRDVLALAGVDFAARLRRSTVGGASPFDPVVRALADRTPLGPDATGYDAGLAVAAVRRRGRASA